MFFFCLVSKITGEKRTPVNSFSCIIFIFTPNPCQLEDPIPFDLLVLLKVGSWDVFLYGGHP